MSSDNNEALVSSVDDLEEWSDEELEENTLKAIHSLDGRRRVENKLEDLRLRRETSEYSFDF